MNSKEGFCMKNNEHKQTNILLRVVRSIGSKSVDSKCSWWFNQPKVPKKMKPFFDSLHLTKYSENIQLIQNAQKAKKTIHKITCPKWNDL